MKIALVCIAKNEDNYIQEWVDYNKKLGFDKIFIYENDWRCSIEDPMVIKIPFDGISMQRLAYNDFIKNNKEYTWAAFFDCDEFLVLKKHKNIKDFICEYAEYPAVGINWVLFGDNNLNGVVGDDYSVLKRFTMREIAVNQHVKSIVKLTPKLIMDVHNPLNIPFINTHKKWFSGPFNYNLSDSIAQLNHYFCKTKEEFIKKCDRGRADTNYKRMIAEFESRGHNKNEIVDMAAYNFFHDK
jgi:hypothetical protein